MFKMALACVIPLLLILLLPLIGLPKSLSSTIAIVLMMLLHFFMMKDHINKKGPHKNKTLQKSPVASF